MPLRFGLSALSAVLTLLSFPPFDFPLQYFSLVPLFLALEKARDAREASNLGGLWGLLVYGILLHWFVRVFGMMAAGLWCALALFPALFCWVVFKNNLLRSRWALPAVPVLWMGIEFFRSEVWFLKFSWFSLGYSFWDELPVFFAGSVGVYGLSLLLVLLNLMLIRILERRTVIAAGFSAFYLVAILLIFSFKGLGGQKLGGYQSARVLMVQSESFDRDIFEKLTLGGINKKNPAKFIVWPEYSVNIQTGVRKHKETTMAWLSGLAKKTKAYLIVGCVEFLGMETSHLFENYALIFSPEGELIGRYYKANPVQFIEKFTNKGIPKSYPIFDTAHGKIGIQICYDLDYTKGAREIVKNGAEVIFQPSMIANFWGRWAHLQHASLVPVRAVESGRDIVRVCTSGPSFIASGGFISHAVGVGEEKAQTGGIFFRQGMTIYHRFGYYLNWVALLVAAFFVGESIWLTFQKSS